VACGIRALWIHHIICGLVGLCCLVSICAIALSNNTSPVRALTFGCVYETGRMLLCMRERTVKTEVPNHASLQRQFSHGHGSDAPGVTGTRISHFLPTSRRIVQFSNGKVSIDLVNHLTFQREIKAREYSLQFS
jgi:hypothetical protein